LLDLGRVPEATLRPRRRHHPAGHPSSEEPRDDPPPIRRSVGSSDHRSEILFGSVRRRRPRQVDTGIAAENLPAVVEVVMAGYRQLRN
jgi:hypothetical protein